MVSYEVDLDKLFEYKNEPPEEVLAMYAAEELIVSKGNLLAAIKHQEIESMAGVESDISFSFRGKMLEHLKRLHRDKFMEELSDDATRQTTLINARRRNNGIL